MYDQIIWYPMAPSSWYIKLIIAVAVQPISKQQIISCWPSVHRYFLLPVLEGIQSLFCTGSSFGIEINWLQPHHIYLLLSPLYFILSRHLRTVTTVEGRGTAVGKCRMGGNRWVVKHHLFFKSGSSVFFLFNILFVFFYYAFIQGQISQNIFPNYYIFSLMSPGWSMKLLQLYVIICFFV